MKYLYEDCNDKRFKWINKNVMEYPQESSRQQYSRSKYLSCETYLTEQEINSLIEFLLVHKLKNWVYIKHTDSKVEHFHILFEFDNAISCLKLLHMVNTFAIALNNDNYRIVTFICMRVQLLPNMIEYLVHDSETSVDKQSYSWDDCKSNDITYWRTLSSVPTTQGVVSSIFIDMDKLSYRQLAVKYGRDFVINYKAYAYYYSLIKTEEGGKENEVHD